MQAQLTFFSQVLDKSCNVVVLGPKVIAPDRPLKVVYMLHGLTGNEGNWSQYTQLPLWARDGHTLFILPDVGRSWYTDAEYGQCYFTYIAQELPMLCRNLFHISEKREDTAVMGNSMGGYGALKCAFSYPERYGFCCAFSPAAMYWEEYLAMPNCAELLDEFRGLFGTELQVSKEDRLPELMQSALKKGPVPKVRVACGNGDFLLQQNRRFAQEARKMLPDFRYEEWDGVHDWIFWNEALRRALVEWNP